MLSPINTSGQLLAMHALSLHQSSVTRALERLATGKRINRAGDDPAGMMAAEKLAGDMAKLTSSIKTGEQSRAVFDAAEGHLGIIQGMLQELNGLVVTAANRGGMSDEEREGLQVDAEAIVEGIEFILGSATFDQKLIFQDGFTADLGDGTAFTFGGLRSQGLGDIGVLRPTAPPPRPEQPEGENTETTDKPPPEPADPTQNPFLNLSDIARGVLNLRKGDVETAQRVVTKALEQVAFERGRIGAFSGIELDKAIAMKRATLENTAGAYSKIMDADFAKEVTEFFRADILRRSATMSMAMVNSSAAKTLQLLGGRV